MVSGEHGRLKIEMEAYNPMIRCTTPRDPSLPPRGCDMICDNMLLSTDYTGVRHTRHSFLDIVVPYEVLPSTLIIENEDVVLCSSSMLTGPSFLQDSRIVFTVLI